MSTVSNLLKELAEWDKLGQDPRLPQILRAQLLKLAFNDSSPSTAIKAIEMVLSFEIAEDDLEDLSAYTTEELLDIERKARELISRSIQEDREKGGS